MPKKPAICRNAHYANGLNSEELAATHVSSSPETRPELLHSRRREDASLVPDICSAAANAFRRVIGARYRGMRESSPSTSLQPTVALSRRPADAYYFCLDEVTPGARLVQVDQHLSTVVVAYAGYVGRVALQGRNELPGMIELVEHVLARCRVCAHAAYGASFLELDVK